MLEELKKVKNKSESQKKLYEKLRKQVQRQNQSAEKKVQERERNKTYIRSIREKELDAEKYFHNIEAKDRMAAKRKRESSVEKSMRKQADKKK